MRKALLFAPMIGLCLLLCACGGGGEEEKILDVQEGYRRMTAAEGEAELTCHYGQEERRYTLAFTWTPEGSRVEVLAPDTVEGVAARFHGEELELEYEDLLLDAGTYSGTDLTPLWAVPSSLRAMAEGYPLDHCREDVDGEPCIRLTAEMDGGTEGEKLYYTIWFHEDGLPLRCEIAAGDTLAYVVEFTEFTKEESQENGTAAAEDLGGD